MIRDPALLDFLEAQQATSFEGAVYRATRKGLDPTTYSTAGGRWMVPGAASVLYTSVEQDGALAEISFHLASLSPIPTKPIALHKLSVRLKRLVRIERSDFPALGVEALRFGELGYARTQQIGDAVAFLGYDGMIVPSARWQCSNLVLFQTNQNLVDTPVVQESRDLDWIPWARENKFIPEPRS
jgi:hypothetical protein